MIELCKCKGCGKKQRTGDTYFCALHEPLWLKSDERAMVLWGDNESYEALVATFVDRIAAEENKTDEPDGDDLGRRELIKRLQARHEENPHDCCPADGSVCDTPEGRTPTGEPS